MTIYRITAPNGKTYQIEGPPGASDAEVAQAVLAQHPEAGVVPKPAGFSISDTALAGVGAGVGAAKSVASAFGADNTAAQYLKEKQESLQGMISPERRAEIARRGAAEKKAAESGNLGEEISTFLGGVAEAPIQSLAQGLGSAAPAIVAGAAALVAGAPVAIAGTVALGVRLLMGAVQGAGEVKGSIYDTLTEELKRKGMPEAEAKKQASEAQNYFGKNTDNILVGTALGALASGTGPVEGVLSRGLAKATGKKLAEEGAEAVEKGLLRRTAVGGAKEALPEGLQGGQEQFAQNVALSREGIETPAFQGVAGSAARDAAVGALTGAAVSSVGGRKAPAPAPGTPGGPPTESPAERLQREKAEAEAANALPPIPDSYADLVIFSEKVKALPKSPERNAALKEASERRKAIVVESLKANAISEEKAKQFLTAEEAAQLEITKREDVVPPSAEAEPIPEPTVRKTQPEGGLGEEEILALGITKKQPIFKRMVGKDLTDPEQRAAVVADIEAYLTKGLGGKGEAGSEARMKLAAFKESLTNTTPTETENVGQAVEQASGESPVVAGKPGAGVPTGRPVGPEPSGVVSPEPDAGQPVAGEGQQPSAVAPAPAPAPSRPPILKFTGAEMLARAEEAQRKADEAAAAQAAPAPEPAPAPAPAPEPAPAPAPAPEPAPTVESLKAAQQKLLTPKGALPAPKSKKRVEYDAIQGQIDKLQPPTPKRAYEPPVRAGLTPQKQRTLRAEYAIAEQEARALEKVRDDAEERLQVAQFTGNEAQQQSASDALADANKEWNNAADKAEKTYWKLYDKEKAEFEGKVGEAYVDELRADRKKRDVVAGSSKEDQGIYPYNLKTLEAVHDELQYQSSHTQEYKAYIEKYFTPNRKLKKGASEADAIAEGQKLLDKLVLYQRSRAGAVDLEESELMDDALRDVSFERAVDYAIENARDSAEQAILVKVKRRLTELKNKGVEFGFSLVPKGRMLVGALGRVDHSTSGLGEATKIEVRLNGFTEDPSTSLSQETLVHELVHAATMAQIKFAPQGTAAIKLKNLQQDLVAEYNKRFKAGTLTEEDKQDVFNALKNADELLAYGLTNDATQKWLASVSLPSGESYLSRFFSLISQVLGLTGKENTALAKLMSISEEVLDESIEPHVAEATKKGLSFGKQPNTTGYPSWALAHAKGRKIAWVQGGVGLIETVSTAGTPMYLGINKEVITYLDIRDYNGNAFSASDLAAMQQAATNLTPQTAARATGEATRPSTAQKISSSLGENKVVGLRTKLMDNLAGVSAFFADKYNNSVRDNSGNVAPDILMSRALDYTRFSKAAQDAGTLVVDADTLVRAKELEADIGNGVEKVSYEKAMREIAEEAKRRKLTPRAFITNLSDVLYGHREFNLAKVGANIEFLLSPKEQAAYEAQFNADPFTKRVSKMLDAVRFSMIDTMQQVGRLSPETAQAYKDAVGYIPIKRIGEYDTQFASAKSGKRGVAQMKRMSKLAGSEAKQSRNVIENFSGLMDWMTSETMRTQATSRALPEMALFNAAKLVPSRDAMDDSQKGAIVPTYINGKEKLYYVPDPALLGAFSFEPAELGNVIRAFQKASQVLRAGVTSMPPFALKQVADDIVRAYVHSGVDNPAALTARILFNLPKMWLDEVRGMSSASTREMEKSGIVATYDITEQGNLKNILEETGIDKRSIGKAIFRVMEAGAKASDLAVRKAIFDQTIQETKSAQRPEGDTVLAENRAREIINFSRRGNSKFMDMMVRTVPFFNAYARSMDKLAVAAAGNKVGMTTGYSRALFFRRMTVLAAMGVMYALAMQDDEEYQKLADNVRDRNWVFPYGKYLGFTPALPIPNELAYFFKAIPERVVRYYKYQGTPEEQQGMQLLGELVRSGVDIFVPPNVISQFSRPIIENMVNYSFFMGRPLESQMQRELRPYKREGAMTSDTMKLAAEKLEGVAQSTGVEAFAVSPIMLENLMRGVFGTTAGVLLAFTDSLVNPTRTDRPLHQTMKAQLTGASAFMKDGVGSRYIDDIYRLERSVEQIAKTYAKEAETDADKANRFLKDNIGLYAIRDGVKSVMSQIREMNKLAARIDKMSDIDSEERRNIMNEYRTMQNEIARHTYLLRSEAANIQNEVDRAP